MNDMLNPFKKEIELIIKNKKKLIVVVLSIIVCIAILSNVFSKKGSKEYYINMVKNMDSPIDGYNFEEFLNMISEDSNSEIEWDYEENKKVVSVSIIENGIDSTRYYSVKNGSSNIEEVYIDGSSVNDNLSNVIGDAFDKEDVKDKEFENKENESLEGVEENYGYYKPNELGEQYVTYMSNSLANDDIETIKETVLEMFFMNCSNSIGDSLNNYLEDIKFSDYQTEKGTTITIKGYSNKLGNDLMVSILATYEGNVYLTEIREGKSNTMIDISTQLKIANDIFR
ncbi:hypothetical protein PMY35_17705 [Clostridium tertium]|uniref:hypothetical protein n=1 Tax=Clostridium tertium TaxID=1559 RepID=UPI00189CAAF2|nr:hypothetical protein [Clostridium tertium]MDB1949638.1 hypothetical protein [Clostridium tertium]